MKKIFIPLFAVFSFFVLNMTTSAQSLETIVNDNGITITPEQYEYLSIFYSKNQIMKLFQTEIDEIIAKNMVPVSTQVQYIRTDSYIGFDNKVKESHNTIISEEEYENPIMPLSACENSLATRCWETTYKKLEFCGYISPDDPTSLYFTVSNCWKILP